MWYSLLLLFIGFTLSIDLYKNCFGNYHLQMYHLFIRFPFLFSCIFLIRVSGYCPDPIYGCSLVLPIPAIMGIVFGIIFIGVVILIVSLYCGCCGLWERGMLFNRRVTTLTFIRETPWQGQVIYPGGQTVLTGQPIHQTNLSSMNPPPYPVMYQEQGCVQNKI